MITGKVKDVNIDQNGNIRVVTDYFDENGSLVHANGVTRYSFAVSENMDEILALLEDDIRDHAAFLIARKHALAKNFNDVAALRQAFVGREVTATSGILRTRKKVLTVDEKKVISEAPRG